jgi:hypothetical protein
VYNDIRHNLGLWLKVDARAVGEATPSGGGFHSQYAALFGKTRSAKEVPIKSFKVRGFFNGISGQNIGM